MKAGSPFLFVILFFCTSSINAQGKLVIVENADSLVGKVIDGENARELIGNVRFSQENVRVSCDRALQYLDRGLVVLTGNVVVQDDSIILRAPRGLYHSDSRRAEAFDDVSLTDGTTNVTSKYGQYFIEPKIATFRTDVAVKDTGSVLTSDTLTYFRTEKRSVAERNVAIYNKQDDVTIYGEHFENFAPQQFSRMTGEPYLVQFDRDPRGRIDTLVVRCRVMESYQDSTRRLVAIDSVEIVRSDLAAIGGLATFFTVGDSILLRQVPVVWYRQSQVSGDSINVYLKERALHIVAVLGNAFAISQNDTLRPSRFDQITGETLHMFFEDQELDKITVDTRAISVYHLYEDSAANGLNKTSGDRLVLDFVFGQVSAIRIYGGVEGQYVPENLVQGHEMEYAIAGFNWREERPRITRK
ncbi:MAG: OstA-like protein [Bacteroidota bacterium]